MGKGKKKGHQADDDWEAEAEELRAEMGMAGDKVDPAAEPQVAPAKAAAAAAEKPAKPTVEAAVEGSGGSDGEGSDDEGGAEPAAGERLVKTAAQKKAEKKEREKAKKAATKKTQLKAPAVTDALTAAPTPTLAATEDVAPAAEEASSEGASDDQHGDEGSAADAKKKAKKKKKTKKEEPKAKKPAGIAAKLKAQMEKEAEERRVREEKEAEERRAWEEAENRRLEAVRQEEERKQKKKEKEKERKERLRREGKLLTNTEKRKKAMQQEKLAQMAAAGMELPIETDVQQTQRPVYTKRGKKSGSKPAQENGAAEPTESMEELLSPEELVSPEPLPEAAAPALATEAEAEPADSWEALDGLADVPVLGAEEEKEQQQLQLEKEKPAAGEDGVPATSTVPIPPTVQAAARSKGKAEADKVKEEAAQQLLENRYVKDDFELFVTTRPAEDALRCPIICVLGHVDTGKTKLLDKIRRSHVQDSEAGGITQQIGATYFPGVEVTKKSKSVRMAATFEMRMPGLLIIDTPGHESFSNLRSRGSSLSDIAVLVIDIMHGLENQTIESIELLRARKTPFVVALNKVDRLVDWIPSPDGAFQNTLKKQKANTIQEFETRLEMVKVQLAEKGFNSQLYYDSKKNMSSYLNIVPTSAHTGEGIPDLLFLLCHLSQKLLEKQLTWNEELQATVMEVKAIAGHGTTVDVILRNGCLHEGQTIVLCGTEGPIATTIRSLLMPEPLKELRVKNAYRCFKTVFAANGVKITAKDLDKAVAGLPLLVANTPEEIEALKEEVRPMLENVLKGIQTTEKGVYVQASTLGSLEALLEFLRTSKIPVAGINIGPVHRRDINKASIQLEKDKKYALVLAFDVAVDRDAQNLADELNIKIFTANIIYHLFDAFTKHMEDVKNKLRAKYAAIAIFPCKLRILPEHIFNARDPIVLGVAIEEGICKVGTPLTVPSKEFCDIGVISSIEVNHESQQTAKKGQEVCIKIEAVGEKKLYGRHFDFKDQLVSRVSRESINACKEYFRDDLNKDDWKLVLELKRLFEIL